VGHDVFISYSSHDKPQADAVCATLEAKGIRCWIAPRDVIPGEEWGAAIVDAIRLCSVMVVVFSSHANASPQIRREVERAVHDETVLIPFRIEDVAPEKSLEFFLGAPHWLDALTPPLEAHLENLAVAVRSFLALREPAMQETVDVPSGTTAHTTALSAQPTPAGPNVAPASATQRHTEAAPIRTVSGRLPLSGFFIWGLAVDSASSVYVTRETALGPVLCCKLPAGAADPVELPFVGLSKPKALAVDFADNLYVVDEAAKAVFKFAHGTDVREVLPFNDLTKPSGVAVDTGGAVYLVDNARVLKLAPGTDTPITLPFTNLKKPADVAVDTAGAVYVADAGHKRVLMLAGDASTPTALPFPAIKKPSGVAVGTRGVVYVADAHFSSNEIWRLAPNDDKALRFGIGDSSRAVATDREDNVYVVVNSARNYVLKIPASDLIA
jgi:TIR domain/NHL repeat